MMITGNKPKDNRPRILAIDDAAIMLRRIALLLNDNFSVVTVNSGHRALKFLERERPDLILLDIKMIPKDGFETLREIRKMEGCEDIPVIMLTGLEDKNSVIESANLGVAGYILKPFESDVLIDRINHALTQHRLNKQAAAKEKKQQAEAKEQSEQAQAAEQGNQAQEKETE